MKAGVRPCMTWCFPTLSLYRLSLYRFLLRVPPCTMQLPERSEHARCIAATRARVERHSPQHRKNRSTCDKNPGTRQQIAHALRKAPPCNHQLRPCKCQLRPCNGELGPCNCTLQPRNWQLRPCNRQLRPCRCEWRPRNCELLTSSCEMRPRKPKLHAQREGREEAKGRQEGRERRGRTALRSRVACGRAPVYDDSVLREHFRVEEPTENLPCMLSVRIDTRLFKETSDVRRTHCTFDIFREADGLARLQCG